LSAKLILFQKTTIKFQKVSDNSSLNQLRVNTSELHNCLVR